MIPFNSRTGKQREGFTLIIVILVLAFLLSVGVAVLSITGTGPRISDNVRSQEQAFNSAEAGFDVTWAQIENNFTYSGWTSFADHYLKDPTGIDDPQSSNYFRKLTDQEILNLLDPGGDGLPDYDNLVFFRQPYIPVGGGSFDANYTFTVFLIDDEVGGGTPDPGDVIVVSIGTAGTGPNMNTCRIEVVLACELSGSGS